MQFFMCILLFAASETWFDQISYALVQIARMQNDLRLLCRTLRPLSSELRFTCAVNPDNWAVLSVLCDLQAAENRSSRLQVQLAQRNVDLHDVKQQLVKLQKDFRDKCDEVIAD